MASASALRNSQAESRTPSTDIPQIHITADQSTLNSATAISIPRSDFDQVPPLFSIDRRFSTANTSSDSDSGSGGIASSLPTLSADQSLSRSRSSSIGERAGRDAYRKVRIMNRMAYLKEMNVTGGTDGPIVGPTVFEHQPFDPAVDAKVLYDAMRGLGTHESAIIELLSKRTNKQRQAIASVYRDKYGKSIIKAFKGELTILFSGHLDEVLEGLFKTPAEYEAQLLHHAITGISTDEDAVIDIICTRTNRELRSLKTEYALQYKKELSADIDSHVHSSSDFKKLLNAVLMGARESGKDVNEMQAKWEGRALYDAGPRHWAKDDALIAIFAGRSFAHLRLVIREFEKLADIEVETVVGKELHGDVGHLLEHIVKFVKNKNKYFAERLHNAFKGVTVYHKVLVRTVIERCEQDMGHIKKQFDVMYTKTLASHIETHTSGHYRNMLLALCGCHEELRKYDAAHKSD
ncbi:hypothetical protein RvY_02456 [Ramazzottius varieornatus]|uniref:Annexin n=1 Tax=Ramazzottius varieornatus TaxID=947166 RepID=A0A1D1UQM2_RAMVA|nr:hypothetical protein RvY_02456 [Ramazzottius varieornatus]